MRMMVIVALLLAVTVSGCQSFDGQEIKPWAAMSPQEQQLALEERAMRLNGAAMLAAAPYRAPAMVNEMCVSAGDGMGSQYCSTY